MRRPNVAMVTCTELAMNSVARHGGLDKLVMSSPAHLATTPAAICLESKQSASSMAVSSSLVFCEATQAILESVVAIGKRTIALVEKDFPVPGGPMMLATVEPCPSCA